MYKYTLYQLSRKSRIIIRFNLKARLYVNLLNFKGECTVALLDPAKKSTPPHIDHILRIYQGGAPCHSSLFSPRDFDVIVERPPEVEVEGCFSPCKDGM